MHTMSFQKNRITYSVDAPFLSVIVIAFNMQRELPRTLTSLSSAYQLGVPEDAYEVIVVDNGSQTPLTDAEVSMYGKNFHNYLMPDPNPSPGRAANRGASLAKGQYLCFMIDGAHLLSPRVLYYALQAYELFDEPLVAIDRFFIGPGQQASAAYYGYNREIEDKVLRDSGWPQTPYNLFSFAAFMGEDPRNWFSQQWESNCLFLGRRMFKEIGGVNESFEEAGGGFINLDLFVESLFYPPSKLVNVLGEGSFHQYHEGITTNIPYINRMQKVQKYRKQYESIRKKPFSVPNKMPYFLGKFETKDAANIKSPGVGKL